MIENEFEWELNVRFNCLYCNTQKERSTEKGYILSIPLVGERDSFHLEVRE